ncbi:MAG: FtsX-like permease family protein [Tissierellia bacterium]|nr:FtsX-like permease family protein [Tissierellia bacterium]
MNRSLYGKLSTNGMKNNRELYTPFTLASGGVFTLFFIILSMGINERFKMTGFSGMDNIQLVLRMGSVVIALFSLIFLYYTYSFILKRRQKELALYQILGMERKHLCKIILHELLHLLAKSLLIAFLLGNVIYKLSENLLLRISNTFLETSFFPSVKAYLFTVLLALFIYLLIALKSLWKIRFLRPIELLREANAGEKKPKMNIFYLISSLVLLSIGYTMAVRIQSPIEALGKFFIATLLVIIGTELGFVAISVGVLQFLQKRSKYYYQPKKFTNISGLISRMVKNGVSLANIAIIATAVMILLSTASALNYGIKEMIRNVVPRDGNVYMAYEDYDEAKEEVKRILKEKKLNIRNERELRGLNFYAVRKNGEFQFLQSGRALTEKGSCFYAILCLDDMKDSTLKPGFYGEKSYFPEHGISIGDKNYKFSYQSEELPIDHLYDLGMKNAIILFENLEGVNEFEQDLNHQNIPYQRSANYGFDIDNSNIDYEEFREEFLSIDGVHQYQTFETKYKEFRQITGGVVYTGYFLGIVFMVALALIIYYKQLTEGYEDLQRYQVLQRVGMTKKEIKATINDQIRMVFLLPLFVATIHMAFAFPMVSKILNIFYLENLRMYIKFVLLTLGIVVLLYLLIYQLTSKVYYRIVTSKQSTRKA